MASPNGGMGALCSPTFCLSAHKGLLPGKKEIFPHLVVLSR